ncbi:MAG: hypothetical protein COB02_18070 [Candidatus Cloacimonadota bacterium]|nr:MAG: hypothetical protein COB02_18070 [Candidatus Cloacimonadota bacterium]
MFKIKLIKSIETSPLRKSILRPFQNEKFIIYEGDNHKESFHLGIFDDKKLIGILSILKEKSNDLRLRGMAIDLKYQKMGLGSKLLNFALNKMKNEKKYKSLWCNARIIALSFYKNLGFLESGSIFNISNIGQHIKMIYFFDSTKSIIYGKRIKLRQLSFQDQSDIYHNIQDQEIDFNTPIVFPFSLKNAIEYIIKSNSNKNHVEFGIEHYDSNQIIGVMSLYNIHSDKPFIGYWLTKKFRGLSYTKEALQLILKFSKNKLNIYKLEATVLSTNIASIKLLEGFNFNYKKTTENFIKIKSKFYDLKHFQRKL